MGILDSLFGRERKENIDEKDKLMHSGIEHTPQKEVSFVQRAAEKEAAMVKKYSGRARIGAGLALATTLLVASPTEAADPWAGIFGTAIRSVERVTTSAMREDTNRRREELRRETEEKREETKRIKESYGLNRDQDRNLRDIALGEQRLEAAKAREETNRLRENQRTKQVEVREGSDVQETEIEESERTRREGLKKGVHDAGSDVVATGSSPYSRRRTSDATTVRQMEGATIEEIPGESGGLSEQRRDELVRMGIADHKDGRPAKEFRSMPEKEKDIYGGAWNAEERQEPTGIILKRR